MSDTRKLHGLEAAHARGRAVVEAWCNDGTLTDAAEVEPWLGACVDTIDRNALVAFMYRGEPRYLACLVDLPNNEVARVPPARCPGWGRVCSGPEPAPANTPVLPRRPWRS